MVFLRFFSVLLLWLCCQAAGCSLLLWGGGMAERAAELTTAVLLWQLLCALLVGFRAGSLFRAKPLNALLISGCLLSLLFCLLLSRLWPGVLKGIICAVIFIALLLPFFCSGMLGAGWGRLKDQQRKERSEREEENLACGAEKC